MYQLQMYHGSWRNIGCPKNHISLCLAGISLRPERLWRILDERLRVVLGEGAITV